MGMDHIAVDDGDDGSVKVSPGKIQRSGVETAALARHPITRTIKAPGVVQRDERRISVMSPRFDGFVEKVSAVTSGTHVKAGDALATVFGQELLNQGARLLIEQTSKDQTGGVIGARRHHSRG